MCLSVSVHLKGEKARVSVMCLNCHRKLSTNAADVNRRRFLSFQAGNAFPKGGGPPGASCTKVMGIFTLENTKAVIWTRPYIFASWWRGSVFHRSHSRHASLPIPLALPTSQPHWFPPPPPAPLSSPWPVATMPIRGSTSPLLLSYGKVVMSSFGWT